MLTREPVRSQNQIQSFPGEVKEAQSIGTKFERSIGDKHLLWQGADFPSPPHPPQWNRQLWCTHLPAVSLLAVISCIHTYVKHSSESKTSYLYTSQYKLHHYNCNGCYITKHTQTHTKEKTTTTTKAILLPCAVWYSTTIHKSLGFAYMPALKFLFQEQKSSKSGILHNFQEHIRKRIPTFMKSFWLPDFTENRRTILRCAHPLLFPRS